MHFISKNKCILLILAAICFIGPLMNSFFALMACGGMHSPYYFIGYETGFGGRKLLGTIFNFFCQSTYIIVILSHTSWVLLFLMRYCSSNYLTIA